MLRIPLKSQGPSGPPSPLPPGPPPMDAGAPPPLDPIGGSPDTGTDPMGEASKYDAQKVSQPTSGYMGPEAGPFACGHCVHFTQPGSCEIVQGDIDPGGCCNLYESADEGGSPDPDGDPGTDPTQGPPPDAGGPPPPGLPPQ